MSAYTHAGAVGGHFSGVRSIVRYNWGRYGGAVIAIVVALTLRWHVDAIWVQSLLIAATALAVWWTLASLIASWWVYDASGIMDWSRLASIVGPTVTRWINVHAGLDSATGALRCLFPQSRGITLSIYDPVVMTERSIHRARRVQVGAQPAISSPATRLEAGDSEFDVAFLLFAAHEVRAEGLRSRLFAEVYRVLRPGGQLILVEHLRDAANFIAFGPGAFHFFSARSWDRLAIERGFVRSVSERMTPFVRLWVWRKPS